jgi:sugar phosphate isomerase/epimerase
MDADPTSPPLARDLPPLPANRPWRLGTTSYVYPDHILPNVRRLAGVVEDVELVLFQSREADNLPDAATIAELAALRREHGLTFTIHFPTDRQLGHPDARERAAAVDQYRRVADLVQPLEPFAYILHPEGIAPGDGPDRLAAWQQEMVEGVERLVRHGIPPTLLALENLACPFGWCTLLLEAFELSCCLDVGHLWINGCDVAGHVQRWLPRTRVVHLHGVRDGRDHRSLTETDRPRLASFLASLRGPPAFTGVVTLEVFSLEETAGSITVLREMLA